VESLNISRRRCFTGWRSDVGRMIGLHLDSWEGEGVSHRREHSLMRISLNVGTQARKLFVVPRGLQGLQKELGEVPAIDDSAFAHAVMSNTLTTGPSVLEISIPEGAGYIAMTDYLIHDGRTSEQEALDIRFDMRACLRAVL
ncbi:MAG: hypothetical protein KDD69_13430, partial [Bdellovibrionales bacterium]|nr:hypothetical protein [Bdellovibrionales bacterium]